MNTKFIIYSNQFPKVFIVILGNFFEVGQHFRGEINLRLVDFYINSPSRRFQISNLFIKQKFKFQSYLYFLRILFVFFYFLFLVSIEKEIGALHYLKKCKLS